MEVVGHHTEAFQYPSAFLAGLEQTVLERSVRPLIDEQILSVIPTVDYVINSIFPFDS